MKLTALALILASSAAFAGGTYLDNDKTVTHDCAKEPEASIMGNSNTITFTGACTTINVAGNKNTLTIVSAKGVNVEGNNNTVTVAASDAINVHGDNNTVSWKKGLSDKKPKLSNAGKKNTISQTK